MPTTRPIRDRIQALKQEYDTSRPGRESLLAMIDEDSELDKDLMLLLLEHKFIIYAIQQHRH